MVRCAIDTVFAKRTQYVICFHELDFLPFIFGWLTAGRDGRSWTVDLMHGKCEVLVGERKSGSTLEH